jgi:hypothetical protein
MRGRAGRAAAAVLPVVAVAVTCAFNGSA